MGYKVIALIGMAGSGKDTVLKQLLKTNKNFHKIISYTTRPKREGEVEGVNYFYISPIEFREKILNGEMLEATGFRDWYYGTTLDLLDKDKINIGIFDPIRLKNLMENKEIEVLVFNIIASDKTRLMRQLNRENNPDVKEIIRRFEVDSEDFENIKFDYEYIINENKKDLRAAVKDILSAAKEFQDKKD